MTDGRTERFYRRVKMPEKIEKFFKERNNSKSGVKGKCGGRRNGYEKKEGTEINEM